jgi:hypothetical protein
MAESHRKEDPATTAVFLAEDPAEVRLVEVSRSVSSAGEVLPFRFAARPDLGVPAAPSSTTFSMKSRWPQARKRLSQD